MLLLKTKLIHCEFSAPSEDRDLVFFYQVKLATVMAVDEEPAMCQVQNQTLCNSILILTITLQVEISNSMLQMRQARLRDI